VATREKTKAAFILKVALFKLTKKTINLKKQLTADERRYTPRNQRLSKNVSLTIMVNLIIQTTPVFIGVHRRIRRFNSRF